MATPISAELKTDRFDFQVISYLFYVLPFLIVPLIALTGLEVVIFVVNDLRQARFRRSVDDVEQAR